MSFEYIKDYYGVPAALGRRVIVNGRPGIIAADRGHYIGVNFDSDKPGVISNCHPTWMVEYLDCRNAGCAELDIWGGEMIEVEWEAER